MKFYRWLGWDQVEINVLNYRSEGSDYIIEYEVRDNDGWIATEQYDRLLVETAIHEYMDRFYS